MDDEKPSDLKKLRDLDAKSLMDRAVMLEEIESIQFRLAVEPDHERRMELLAEAAARLVGAETLLIPVVSPDNREVLYPYGVGRLSGTFKGLNVAIENAGLCGWVMENRKPLVSNEVPEDPRVNRDTVKALGVTCAALAPLIARGRIIGGLTALNKLDGSTFTEDDIHALTHLANYAAAIIDHSLINQELRTENIKVASILDSVRDGILFISRNGVVLNANAAFGRMFGLDPSGLVGKGVMDAVEDPESVEAINWRARAATGSICREVIGCERSECPMHKLDMVRCWAFSDGYCHEHGLDAGKGGKSWSTCSNCPALRAATLELEKPKEFSLRGMTLRVTSSLVDQGEDKDLFGEVIVFHDATEEKRIERQRADFISMVTHDLKSPLTAITGYCDLMVDEDDMDAVRDMAHAVSRNSAQLLKMINDFLALSRVEAGNIDLNLMSVSVRAFLALALQSYTPLARDRGVELTWSVDDGTPDILADIDQLGRILDNLVSNSLKYVTAGGYVRVSAGKGTGGFVEMKVEDDGPGIRQEDLPKVFDMYYRGGGGKPRGAGLGLAIVKSLTAAHGGKVWVNSVEGKGCSFMLALPAVKQQ